MCFKIVVDIDDASIFNDLYYRLTKLGDLLYVQDCFFLWVSKPLINKKYLLKMFQECEFENYFIKEADEAVVKSMDNPFILTWYHTHIAELEREQLEKTKQPELQQMLHNIDEVSKALQKQEQKNRGEVQQSG